MQLGHSCEKALFGAGVEMTCDPSAMISGFVKPSWGRPGSSR
jgi:hypothetical protein